jgi:RNA polymerase sigma factor (sigma-70 family)
MSDRRDKEVEAFYDAHQEKLLGFVRGMGLSFHDAEDVVNDCFEVMWRRWDKLRGENLRAYLYTVAKNEVYKRSRRRSRRPEDLLADPPAVTARDFSQQVADQMTSRETLRQALAALSDREREAVLLRYYVECDVAETSTIMDGIKKGAVKRYAFDGRRKLRHALSSGPEDTRKAETR